MGRPSCIPLLENSSFPLPLGVRIFPLYYPLLVSMWAKTTILFLMELTKKVYKKMENGDKRMEKGERRPENG